MSQIIQSKVSKPKQLKKILWVQPYMHYFLESLPQQLANKDVQIDVLTYNKRKDRSQFQNAKINYHFIEAFNFSIPNMISDFPFFRSLEAFIKEINPDIIHINNLPFLTTFQGVYLAKRLGLPSVVQVHGVTAERGRILNTLQSAYIRTIGKYIFENTNRVICLTSNDAKQVISYGCPIRKIRIIHNGVDIFKFKPSTEFELEGQILWLGRFVNEKNLDCLISAMKILSTNKEISNTNLQLLLVGNGPTKTRIQELILSAGLERLIKVRPAISHSLVPEYLNQASIFVLPSLREGMPYVLLEAMSSGKAVIASNISGINNVIVDGENGVLFHPNDATALAYSIIKLIRDRNLRLKLGVNARQLMFEKYDLNLVVQEVKKVYDEAMNETS